MKSIDASTDKQQKEELLDECRSHLFYLIEKEIKKLTIPANRFLLIMFLMKILETPTGYPKMGELFLDD